MSKLKTVYFETQFLIQFSAKLDCISSICFKNCIFLFCYMKSSYSYYDNRAAAAAAETTVVAAAAAAPM
jgi:hypothetical protein